MCFWVPRVGRWPEAPLMAFGFAFIYACFIRLFFFLPLITYLICLFCPIDEFVRGHTCAVSVVVRSHLTGIRSSLWPYVSQGSN